MKKILLVDDDESIRETIPHVLSYMAPNEFEFDTAQDGKEALEKILSQGDTNHFYALMTDFNMPKMNGGELIREILKKEISFTRIIIFSGDSDNRRSLSDLVSTEPHIFFLSKPTGPDAILKLLKH